MKFKKLIINNFRQFKGTNEIEFSTDPEKNITIFYGGITAGKTTLLQAFNWVLYKKLNLDCPEDLLNYEVAREMKPGETAEVSIELYVIKDDDRIEQSEYRFKRIQNYSMNLEGRVIATSGFPKIEKKKNDTWITINNFEEEANKILPQNLSPYFFFDGERMNKLSEEQREASKEVGNSVRSILGLEHFYTAIKHLKGGDGARVSVIGELRKKLNSSANADLENLKNDIEKYDGEIDNAKRKIEEYEIEIKKLEALKDSKEEIIATNKETYKKQQAKEEIKRKLEKLENDQLKLQQQFANYFNNYYLDFFYYGLNDKLQKLEQTGILNKKTEAVPLMHQKSIEFLIDRGQCLCGEKITQNDEHYKALIEEMKKLPPQCVNTSISEFKKEAKVNISEMKANNFKEEIVIKCDEILNNYNEINQLKDEIEKTSKDIENNVDVGSLERDVREIENNIRNLYIKKGNEQTEIKKCKEIKEKAESKINELARYDAKNKEILEQMEYAEHIVDILEKNYTIRERELIHRLEKEINKYLGRIYTGDRKMKITSDYKFKLVYNEEDITDSPESVGLGVVKAISFMCGLLDVAKSKILEEVEDETMYPLVLDAPLSNIDSIHRRNVMDCLPEIASQIIFFIWEKKELNDISEEAKAKISQEYTIHKINEAHSEVIVERRKD